MLRQRQAEEEKNDFDYSDDPASDDVAPDDKGCESEEPNDDEPGSPAPFSFEEVVTTTQNRNLRRRVPPQPYVAETPKPTPQKNPNLIRRVGHMPPTRAPVFYHDIGGEGEDDDEDMYLNNDPVSTPPPSPQASPRSKASVHAPTSTSTPTPQVIRSSNGSANAPAEPLSLRKRKSPPATQPSALADNIRLIKTVKTEPSGTRNRLIARDLPSMFQAILTDAQGHFRSMATTFAGFPDAVQSQEFATDAWHKSCKSKGVVIEFEEEFCRLITQRASQVRGELKTKARPLTKSLYKFKSTNGIKAAIRSNRELYEDLINKSSYIYEDPKARLGIYESPVIQEVINVTWFANKSDEGIEYSSYFKDGIPLVTIALVLTAIENCLDEWAEGEHSDIAFTAAGYKNNYEAHLKTLRAFAEHTKNSRIVLRLQAKLLRNARRHAKVSPDATAVPSALLSVDDFEAASKEWEERGEQDDDE